MSDISRNKSNTSPELDAAAEAFALLKILELGEQNIREGKTIPVAEAFRRIRKRLNERRLTTDQLYPEDADRK